MRREAVIVAELRLFKLEPIETSPYDLNRQGGKSGLEWNMSPVNDGNLKVVYDPLERVDGPPSGGRLPKSVSARGRLNRYSGYSNHYFNPSPSARGFSVFGNTFVRVLVPLAVFIPIADYFTSPKYSPPTWMGGVAADQDAVVRDIERQFQQVDMGMETIWVPKEISNPEIEAINSGNFEPQAVAPIVVSEGPPAPVNVTGLGEVEVHRAIAGIYGQLVETQLQKLAELQADFDRLSEFQLTLQQRMTSMLAAGLSTLKLYEPGTGFTGFVEPSLSDYYYLEFNPLTQQWETTFNAAKYTADLEAAKSAAKAAQVRAKKAFEADQASAVAEFNRVQLHVRRNEQNFDFVIGQQKIKAQKSLRYRNRRLDRKTQNNYSAALRVINRTLGEVLEVRDIFLALVWNIVPDGKQTSGLWRRVPDGAGKYKLAPVNYRAGLKLLYDGDAVVDWDGFFMDIVANEIEDKVFGMLSPRESSKLTDRPVGLTAGPAI